MELLITDLRSLSSEALRERNTALKEACDRCVSSISASPDKSKVQAQGDMLLRPFLLACGTRSTKISVFAVSALQKLLAQDILDESQASTVTSILASYSGHKDSSVHLKVLQCLTSITSWISSLQRDQLLQLVAICLQFLAQPTSSLVSSTSEVTLRQLTALLFERISSSTSTHTSPSSHELRRNNSDLEPLSSEKEAVNIESMRPDVADGYLLFRDLCLITGQASPKWLTLRVPQKIVRTALSPQFCLELIDSILSDFSNVFIEQETYQLMLHEYLSPSLVKLIASRPSTTTFARVMRVAAAVITQLSDSLPRDTEKLIMMILRCLESDVLSHRGLGLQVIRHICSIPKVLVSLYVNFDGNVNAEKEREKNRLLSAQAHTHSHPLTPSRAPRKHVPLLSTMATAVSNCVQTRYTKTMNVALRPPGSSHRFGVAKQRGVDVTGWEPDTVVQTIGQAITSLSPFSTSTSSSTPTPPSHSAGNSSMLQTHHHSHVAQSHSQGHTHAHAHANTLLDVSQGQGQAQGQGQGQGHSEASVVGLGMEAIVFVIASITSIIDIDGDGDKKKTIKNANVNINAIASGILSSTWRQCLNVLALPLHTNSVDETLVQTVLRSIQQITSLAGQLKMEGLRRAMVSTLCSFSSPGGSLHSGSTILTKNTLMAAETLLNITHGMGNILKDSWGEVLSCFDDLEIAISVSERPSASSPTRSKSRGTGSEALDPSSNPSVSSTAVSDGIDDVSIVKSGMQSLFTSTKYLDSTSLHELLKALSSVSIRAYELTTATTTASASPSASASVSASSVDETRIGRTGFALQHLVDTALANIERIGSTDLWSTISSHLCDIACLATKKGPRTTAVASLVKLVTQLVKFRSELQLYTANANGKDKDKGEGKSKSGLGYSSFLRPFGVIMRRSMHSDTRQMVINGLYGILESYGDIIIDKKSWNCVMYCVEYAVPDKEDGSEMDNGVGIEAERKRKDAASSSSTPNKDKSKNATNAVSLTTRTQLLTTAFKCIQLIVSDFLSNIHPSTLPHLVGIAGTFGQQSVDVNVALTAIGLLWSISDYLANNSTLEMPFDVSESESEGEGEGEGDSTNQLNTSTPSTPIHPRKPVNINVATPVSTNAPAVVVKSRTPGHVKRVDESKRKMQMEIQALAQSVSAQPAVATDGSGEGEMPLSSSASSGELYGGWNDLWLAAFEEMKKSAVDGRMEVRGSALRTMAATICTHGHSLSIPTWDRCIWDILFPLVEEVSRKARHIDDDAASGLQVIGREGGKGVTMMVHHSRDTASKQWDESWALALDVLARIFKLFSPVLSGLERYADAWKRLLSELIDAWEYERGEVALTAMRGVEEAIVAHGPLLSHAIISTKKEGEGEGEGELWNVTWLSLSVMAASALKNDEFSEKAIVLLIEALSSIHTKQRQLFTDSQTEDLLNIVAAALKHPAATSRGELSWETVKTGAFFQQGEYDTIEETLTSFVLSEREGEKEGEGVEYGFGHVFSLSAISRVQNSILELAASFPPLPPSLWPKLLQCLLTLISKSGGEGEGEGEGEDSHKQKQQSSSSSSSSRNGNRNRRHVRIQNEMTSHVLLTVASLITSNVTSIPPHTLTSLITDLSDVLCGVLSMRWKEKEKDKVKGKDGDGNSQLVLNATRCLLLCVGSALSSPSPSPSPSHSSSHLALDNGSKKFISSKQKLNGSDIDIDIDSHSHPLSPSPSPSSSYSLSSVSDEEKYIEAMCVGLAITLVKYLSSLSTTTTSSSSGIMFILDNLFVRGATHGLQKRLFTSALFSLASSSSPLLSMHTLPSLMRMSVSVIDSYCVNKEKGKDRGKKGKGKGKKNEEEKEKEKEEENGCVDDDETELIFVLKHLERLVLSGDSWKYLQPQGDNEKDAIATTTATMGLNLKKGMSTRYAHILYLYPYLVKCIEFADTHAVRMELRKTLEKLTY